MDTLGRSEIVFDDNGVCEYCEQYREKEKIRMIDEANRDELLQKIIQSIKVRGKRKKYDCIIGVSGGTDSTYVALKVKEWGLRPLAVHLDNGWNSELAVENIEKTLDQLDIDLYTHVVDWREFRDIQLSFLKASTPDIEIPTDHAINAILLQLAGKFGVKYVISGSNYNDEGAFPEAWAYGHLDFKYVKGIHKKFGTIPIKTYPYLTASKLLYKIGIKRIKVVAILNYMHFNKQEARALLTSKLGWRDYGGKHNESIYTKFVQEYILPIKFGIDVRKPYLSAPILRGQMTRDEALDQLKESIATEKSRQEQKIYFLKKMGISEQEFEAIMSAPRKTRFDYKSNLKFIAFLRKALNFLRKRGLATS
tara:strand:- start:6813 stop:7907 length:1095 start_codon:yes stop_codon:yes gene_type:complete